MILRRAAKELRERTGAACSVRARAAGMPMKATTAWA